MSGRHEYPFQPVNSTAPSFSATFDNTSVTFALESTSIPRQWQGAGSRVVRLTADAPDRYHISFGTTLAVAASSDSVMVLGGVTEIFALRAPGNTHIAFRSSTDVTVNVTIGYGQ